MNAYLRQDRINEEVMEELHRDDLLMEQLTEEFLTNADLLTTALSDLPKENRSLRRLACVLRDLYQNTSILRPEIMPLRAAMYALVKQQIREVVLP